MEIELYNLKNDDFYKNIMEKFTVSPEKMDYEEMSFVLALAQFLLKKYEIDKRYTLYAEYAYFLILRYSIFTKDYEPLYDFSVNFGFYPITKAIYGKLHNSDNLETFLTQRRIEKKYSRNNYISTFEQKKVSSAFLSSKSLEKVYVAPTSFGKSELIIEHIKKNTDSKIVIITPTKSLLMQTYRNIRKAKVGKKILLHEEMFNGENAYIAIFTQERALRLIDKNNEVFDSLYIDEAHNIFEYSQRAILLTRLIKICKRKNSHLKIFYFSPLISDSNDLQVDLNQNIESHRILFSIKEPEYFEYMEDGTVQKYNRFLNLFFNNGHADSMWTYINEKQGRKNFFYLYSPRKIEIFAKDLAARLPNASASDGLNIVIQNLIDYVHEDFMVIDLLKKGIIYLHGKLPENIKEYLEFKFSQIPEIKYLIANNVILEGMNLPIDTLFIMSAYKLKKNNLVNLIGRVNRLSEIFSDGNQIEKLLPKIHFVNSREYNRTDGKLRNKIELLKKTQCKDEVSNPILKNMNVPIKAKDFNEVKDVIETEQRFFEENDTSDFFIFCKKLISLGINSLYDIDKGYQPIIFKRLNNFVKKPSRISFMDKVYEILISGLENYIRDEEFKRLKNPEAVSYYNNFYQFRNKPLKERIIKEIKYFEKKKSSVNPLLYVGKSFGEISTREEAGQKVYVNLAEKTKKDFANLAIIKIQLEDSFASYKLSMACQLFYDYKLITDDEYNSIMYGSTNSEHLKLIKIGMSLPIIGRLEEANQLKNVSLDENNNLNGNSDFFKYKESVDDFFKFELSKYF